MEASISEKRFSLAEYFALEERAEDKHEFQNGRIVERASRSLCQSKIAINFIGLLIDFIETNKPEMHALNSGIKICLEKFNWVVYPDAALLFEKPAFWNGRRDTIVNPVLIVEMLSEKQKKFDRQGKFRLYQSLPLFREYVLIDQFQPLVEVRSKHDGDEADLWKITSTDSMDASILLRSIGMEMSLADIYFQIPELQGDDWEVE